VIVERIDPVGRFFFLNAGIFDVEGTGSSAVVEDVDMVASKVGERERVLKDQEFRLLSPYSSLPIPPSLDDQLEDSRIGFGTT